MQEKITYKPEVTPEKALNKLMVLCSRAERSSGDARRLMTRWDIDPLSQQEIIDKLIKDRYIDDMRYARAYTREKLQLSGWGIYKIKSALSAKGISQQIISDVLSDVDPGQTCEQLEKVITRKMKTTKAPDSYQLKGKLVRHALARGFEYEQVLQCVDKILKTDN